MIDAAPYLIHKPPMRLVDTIVSCDKDALALTAALTIRSDAPYWDAERGAIKGHWYIELMAQATSILFNSYVDSAEPKMGFLLAISDFRCESSACTDGSAMAPGDQLLITTENKLELEGFYVQRAAALFAGQPVAEGDIKCLADTAALVGA